ncbi:hypothetical protein O181_035036 [Austropuccinia psidii MF-1]|uniref:Uncharacterized protein n=1 Tax=Austropuccinia psidii MF-1 TaxID=1389203 RepID=A0A9Q3D7I8_9BASI|nr:hypothetical protein [Austropuccinia psidii MF-1]
MDVTLELDTRYHERQNEKIHQQKKKAEASKSNSSSSNKKKKNFQKRDKPNSSFLNKHFRNMDLPPSSYHDSLEELWDEEEEQEAIEIVMKVVPSAYHKYLDEFSRVKAEKHPPHHTCDNHRKLEGSLPSAGVIDFSSNQESDTLRAYIAENLEKGFIQPSSSSTAVPVLFVKKQDGGLCL